MSIANPPCWLYWCINNLWQNYKFFYFSFSTSDVEILKDWQTCPIFKWLCLGVLIVLLITDSKRLAKMAMVSVELGEDIEAYVSFSSKIANS